MDVAVLIIWIAGTGMTFDPVRVEYPSMEQCLRVAAYQRGRGNAARCISTGSDIRICANCGAGPTARLGV
jgi:hypothetical protein